MSSGLDYVLGQYKTRPVPTPTILDRAFPGLDAPPSSPWQLAQSCTHWWCPPCSVALATPVNEPAPRCDCGDVMVPYNHLRDDPTHAPGRNWL